MDVAIARLEAVASRLEAAEVGLGSRGPQRELRDPGLSQM